MTCTPDIGQHSALSVLPDVAAIKRTLRRFVPPGQIGEIRVIVDAGTRYGYFFDHEQIDEAAQIAARESRLAKGVYVVMNRIGPELADRPRLVKSGTLTKDEHIARRNFLLVDLDPVRGAEDSSTDIEKEAARELCEVVNSWLHDRGWPECIVCDSSNGWHLLFHIDLPNDSETRDLIKSFLLALAKRFSTDQVGVDISVSNASRITKCYGIVSRKGEHRADRPHRVSSVVYVPDGELYPVSRELIQAVVDDGSLFGAKATNESPSSAPSQPVNGKLILPEVFPVGGRHANLLSVAGYLRAMGFGELEILENLRLMNRTRCGNAKDDAELQDIARDFATKDVNIVMQARIEGADDTAIEKAQAEQKVKNELLALSKRPLDQVALPLARILAELQQTDTTAVETLTSIQLDEGDFPIDYLIPGLLVADQSCILAGPKKCLKTNILIALVLALSSMGKFLGEFFVSRSIRVALISGESGKGVIQETARRIAKSMPWMNLRDYGNAFWCFDLPKLGQPGTVKALVDYIKRHDLQMLIVDPAYLCLPIGDGAGNQFIVGPMLADLTKVMNETGCTIIICHHTKQREKSLQFDPPELNDIAWAGFGDWARQWILLGRREKYNPDIGGHHALWLASGGSAGHSGLWALDIEEGTRLDHGGRRWEVAVRKASEVRNDEAEQKEQLKEQREQQQRAKQRERIVEAYRRSPDGMTLKSIRETLGISNQKLAPINDDLVREKIIQPCDLMKGKRAFPGFRIVSLEHRNSPELVPISSDSARDPGDDRNSLPPCKGESSSSDHTSGTGTPNLADYPADFLDGDYR